MKNCGNCVYKDLLITEEPCMECKYSEYWEEDTDDSDNTNDISLL